MPGFSSSLRPDTTIRCHRPGNYPFAYADRDCMHQFSKHGRAWSKWNCFCSFRDSFIPYSYKMEFCAKTAF